MRTTNHEWSLYDRDSWIWKSLLTATLTEWYKNNGINCISVNLDPGVTELPYVADVDIRDRISLTDIMDTYKLGPNGALILSCDLIATNLESIIPDIEEHSPEYVIIDTPGQIEQFVYRNSGPYVVNNIKFDDIDLLIKMRVLGFCIINIIIIIKKHY